MYITDLLKKVKSLPICFLPIKALHDVVKGTDDGNGRVLQASHLAVTSYTEHEPEAHRSVVAQETLH